MSISGPKTRDVFDRYNITSERDITEAARNIELSQRQAKVAETQEEPLQAEPATIQWVRSRAGVAELADAQDLGSCGVTPVEVQVLSPAPVLKRHGRLDWSTPHPKDKPSQNLPKVSLAAIGASPLDLLLRYIPRLRIKLW
jgi:hypothetical protein